MTQRRTMQDFARRMRWLVDEAYPEAEVVRVVLDNLNTHRRASLYETFPAEEARRIARRLEFHYTPKHGSWLNPVSSTGQAIGDRVQRAVPLLPEAAALRRGGLKEGSRRPGHGPTTPEPPSTGASTPGRHEPNYTAFTLPILPLTEY